MNPKGRVRVCPGCGVLLDSSDVRCFQCNTLVAPASAPAFRLWMKRQAKTQGNVTFELVLLNLVVFLLTWIFSIQKYGFSFDVNPEILNQFGAKNGPLILQGQLWRLVTAIFLHANLMHIVFNMMVLLDLGRIVEGLYGWRLYLFFFIASGAAGYAASVFGYPNAISLGASGGIMGLAGVLLANSIHRWNQGGRETARSLLRWLFLIFIFGFILGGYIDNAAHLGGLLAGFLLALPIAGGNARRKPLEQFLGFITLLAVIASFLVMFSSR